MPEQILTNSDLEKIVDTTDEWIRSRTGIKKRHLAREDETTCDLAEKASKAAIKMAGKKESDIDLIIVATTTPDVIFPSTACLLQQRLNIHGCPAFDLQAVCTGFVYALHVANLFIKSGNSKCALVVGSETMSRIIDWEDMLSVPLDSMEKIYKVNVVGAFHCARAAVPALRETSCENGGEIVNVGSIAGFKASGSCIPYAASKAALHNMTVALARTLAPDRIRVNAVAPGFITGRWLEEGLGEHYESTKAAFEKAMPLGAVCTPADVAVAILSLVEGSDLVTGQILACDAGMSLAEAVQV